MSTLCVPLIHGYLKFTFLSPPSRGFFKACSLAASPSLVLGDHSHTPIPWRLWLCSRSNGGDRWRTRVFSIFVSIHILDHPHLGKIAPNLFRDLQCKELAGQLQPQFWRKAMESDRPEVNLAPAPTLWPLTNISCPVPRFTLLLNENEDPTNLWEVTVRPKWDTACAP